MIWEDTHSPCHKNYDVHYKNAYKGNLQYFIYKNIILRNLYGVDIMREATEIARLRLFLKMVAVVDVNRKDPNLGLEPLPDIDFIWYITFSDGFHLSDDLVKTYPYVQSKELCSIAQVLEEDIQKNSFITTRNTSTDSIEIESFRVNKSKSIIDEIDIILSKYYQFTEEELDFIINYDIKYRMGDELTESEG